MKLNLTKISKTAMFNLKKVSLKSFRDKKEICGGIEDKTVAFIV